MLSMRFFVLLLISLSFHEIQSYDDDFYFEDIDVEFVNGTYFDIETFDISIVYKPNSQNSLSVTIDVLEDPPPNFSVKFVVSTRAFGQVIPTGISIDSNLCEGYASKIFLEEVLMPLGIMDCPPKLGSYGNEDYKPNFMRVPTRLIPSNHVLLDIELHSLQISVLKCKVLISI